MGCSPRKLQCVEVSLVCEPGESCELHGVGLGQRSGQGVQDEVAWAQRFLFMIGKIRTAKASIHNHNSMYQGLRPHGLQRVHLTNEVVQEIASL